MQATSQNYRKNQKWKILESEFSSYAWKNYLERVMDPEENLAQLLACFNNPIFLLLLSPSTENTHKDSKD